MSASGVVAAVGSGVMAVAGGVAVAGSAAMGCPLGDSIFSSSAVAGAAAAGGVGDVVTLGVVLKALGLSD